MMGLRFMDANAVKERSRQHLCEQVDTAHLYAADDSLRVFTTSQFIAGKIFRIFSRIECWQIEQPRSEAIEGRAGRVSLFDCDWISLVERCTAYLHSRQNIQGFRRVVTEFERCGAGGILP